MYQEMVYYNRMHVKTRLSQSILSKIVYLGIFVNRYCTWGDHVDYISSKINTEFGLLKGIKSCLPLDGRKTFVKSFILPLIDYEDICWGTGEMKTLINDLQILHNKAAKIVKDQPIYSSATNALSKLK